MKNHDLYIYYILNNIFEVCLFPLVWKNMKSANKDLLELSIKRDFRFPSTKFGVNTNPIHSS